MIIAIGEILFDIFPRYRRIGGAPFNFAYHAKNLGMEVCFITRIGDDADGSEIFSILENRGFDTRWVQIDKAHKTGRVIVTPDDSGGHEFEILSDAAYDHIDLPEDPGQLPDSPVQMVYFGTLAQRTAPGFNTIQSFLSKIGSQAKRFCDINLRTGNFTDKVLRKSLEKTDVLKLNTAELDYLASLFQVAHKGPDMARWLIGQFGHEVVSVTAGGDGSYIIADGSQFGSGVVETEIVDTVGAGDAYAAVLAIGCLKGLSPETVMSVASDFSAAICTIKGAIPDDPGFYEPFRKALSGAGDE